MNPPISSMVAFSLTKEVLIRHVSVTDLPALEWEGEFSHFRNIFSEAYRLMQLGDVIMWVADLPSFGLIGQLFIQLYSPYQLRASDETYAYIYGFRVRPIYRGRGIGSLLLDKAETDLLQRGFLRITLNVAQDNPDARRLYERRGYHVVAPEPGVWSYLDENGQRRFVNEPAWRMEKQF
jgi:ribosomal protein S18 acetylase RimI-like enzyme